MSMPYLVFVCNPAATDHSYSVWAIEVDEFVSFTFISTQIIPC